MRFHACSLMCSLTEICQARLFTENSNDPSPWKTSSQDISDTYFKQEKPHQKKSSLGPLHQDSHSHCNMTRESLASSKLKTSKSWHMLKFRDHGKVFVSKRKLVGGGWRAFDIFFKWVAVVVQDSLIFFTSCVCRD
jgi:hypothetical protein